jgi:hypothetical protein
LACRSILKVFGSEDWAINPHERQQETKVTAATTNGNRYGDIEKRRFNTLLLFDTML